MSHIYIVLVRTSRVYKYFENKYDMCVNVFNAFEVLSKNTRYEYILKNTRHYATECTQMYTICFKNDSLFF